MVVEKENSMFAFVDSQAFWITICLRRGLRKSILRRPAWRLRPYALYTHTSRRCL
jgi:hypothetical protein